ncbi:MAG: hypothetical protein IPO58_01200 [Betaproteobacteria bacterium]|nr:hypothetical protein [Betaproteobacteria bacterium]MBK9605101.1 hypothetical protein [Betaproteobacteria bacterium]
MRWMMLSLLAGTVLVSGCASLPTESRSNIDFAKVARIENAARAAGVSVYWVNYPTRQASAVN